MSAVPVEGLDDKTVIVCISPSHSERARVARLMGGSGTLLMFSDLDAVRRVLFGAREPEPAAAPTPAVRRMDTVVRGPLVIDPNRQRVTWAGVPLPLTRIEREVLAALATPPSRVWTYRELYERVWGADYLDDPSAIRSTIKRLRAKLRAAGATIALESTRGVGFYLAELGPDGAGAAPARR
ncbi:winged helix-turn-helix domain-containing protein [Thermopolyspora sp. NPDC052614]|uniref:winged helix-turn-helix domain-containing protein n=1 Tax=Thermopolyspora sp. NPDC052614 TaxID=3155682 RepID=UPI0034251380